MGQSIQEWTKEILWKTALKNLRNCLSRPRPLKVFKGCLPQNLRSALLNTSSHNRYRVGRVKKVLLPKKA